jgi:NTE family protein
MATTASASTGASGRTAFVLTGGGSLGAIQVGMMTALHEHGIDPDLLVGTSVGAVNAAYIAGPGTTGQRLESLAELWTGMRRQDVFVTDPRRWLRAARGVAPSVFSSGPLRLLLATHLGYDAFEDARLELAITATDLVTGAGLFLRSGSVVDAVAASAAVPGLLPPVRLGEHTLVDGAIGHASAMAHADAAAVDDIYLLPAGYPCAGPRATRALAVALTALTLLLHRQLVQEVRSYAGHARLHVAPPLCPLSVSPADFAHGDSLMQRARDSTDHWLSHPADHGHDDRQDAEGVLAFHGRHVESGETRPNRHRRPHGAPAKGRLP